jgi:hypothetical protein
MSVTAAAAAAAAARQRATRLGSGGPAGRAGRCRHARGACADAHTHVAASALVCWRGVCCDHQTTRWAVLCCVCSVRMLAL